MTRLRRCVGSCFRRPCADHSADRQRDDLDAQDDLACERHRLHRILYAVQQIYAVNYETIPLLIVASIWYLAVTSVLSVGQYYVERHYSRGSSRARPTPLRAFDGACNWGHVGVEIRAALERPMLKPNHPQALRAPQVLKGITLEVRRGEVTCLLGPSGSASRPSCAASTTSRRSTPAGSGSTNSSSATARWAPRLTSCARRRSPASRRDRDGLPALQPLSAHDRAPERDRGAHAGEEAVKGGVVGRGRSCSTASVSPASSQATPRSSPAASSSGLRSPGRSRWTPS